MRSQMCKLNSSKESMDATLAVVEAFASHTPLSGKEAMHLRLLAEEMLGLVSGVLEFNEGTFWMEGEQDWYELHLSASAEVGTTAREHLIGASSMKKNALHRGVTGKIRQALEWLLGPHGPDTMAPMGGHNGMPAGTLSPSYQEWSLEGYRSTLDAKAVDWDEMEKSVLGKLADDVRVGVKSNRVEIVIKKNY